MPECIRGAVQHTNYLKALHIKHLRATVTVALALLGSLHALAQSTVSVDTTKNWIGYMNVFDLNNAYQFGSGWGIADLDAYFTGTNTLTLTPNTSIDRDKPNDPYWWVGGTNGAPNKIMDASMYVQDDTLAGQTVTFSGTCLTNSLTGDYSVVAFIKDFIPDYTQNTPATVTLSPGQPFTVNLQTSAGHHVQYGFETIGPNARVATVGSLGQVVLAVNNADPSLGTVASQILVEGQTANFSIAAKGTAPFAYQWSYGNATDTNNLVDGGRISGSQTKSLVITNIAASDAGTYFVTVTNSVGSGTAQASLAILPLAQAKTNLLIDPGFESGIFATTPTAGWLNYNGAAYQTTANNYPNGGPNVQVLDGIGCFLAYSTGPNTYNGCYQTHPANPGEAFAADAWFFTSSSDPITGTGTADLEIKFLDAGGNLVGYARSAALDANSAQDTWIHLQVTNVFATDYVTSLGTSQAPVAPTGTAAIQVQVTYHADTGGTVYVDEATAALKAPVATAVAHGGSVNISFPTLYGPTYQVLYKTKLSDTGWQVLSEVTGDGTVKTVSDKETGVTRFYVVNTR